MRSIYKLCTIFAAFLLSLKSVQNKQFPKVDFNVPYILGLISTVDGLGATVVLFAFFFLQGELLRSPLRNSQIYNTCCSLSALLYITSENLPCNWKSVVCIFDHPHFPLNTPVTGQPPICSLLL